MYATFITIVQIIVIVILRFFGMGSGNSNQVLVDNCVVVLAFVVNVKNVKQKIIFKEKSMSSKKKKHIFN